MKKIIINADDCGISKQVDMEIERCILAGKITSTTIMANMSDFDGAVRLYNRYRDIISFGWHINIDEGEPLTRSQLLLDRGFFLEKDGKILLNGMSFSKRYLDARIREDIKKELRAQWTKLMDNGIDVTHADSHHFCHSQLSMVQIIPSLFQELNIKRCRHVTNYGTQGFSNMARLVWETYFKLKGFKMTDTFSSFFDYYRNPSLKQGEIVELMVHPGHPKPVYNNEYQLMMNTDYHNIWPSFELITYKEL